MTKFCQTCRSTGRLVNGGRCPHCNPAPTRLSLDAARRANSIGARFPAGDAVRRALAELPAQAPPVAGYVDGDWDVKQ